MNKYTIVLSFTFLVFATLLSAYSGATALHEHRGENTGQSEALTPWQDVRRIVFLGDSITQAGEYVVDIECRLLARGFTIEILNLGLGSETAADLTETENAGHVQAYGFGRPAISERLERVLSATQPDMLVACYGMNDGGSLPADETGLQRFSEAIARLRETALNAGVKRAVLCTPPVYDAKGTAPGVHDENLARYSAWMLSKRAEGWDVVDLHGPMRAALDAERARNPEFVFAKDGVHPGREGHWNMARSFLEHCFEEDLGAIASAENIFNKEGDKIRKLVRQRMQLRFGAWMTQIGHTRPGVVGGPDAPAGMSLDDANAKAEEITRQITALAPTSAVSEKRTGIPTPEQIAWHEMELQMFLCLDPCTWQGREYDDHSTPLADINPRALDTNQWCEAAKSFGAKQILFVAKHTGGFCWWPTETTEYCVRNIAWKEGKGDVLGELAESCRRHGLKLGVYIYPGDDQWGAGIGSGGRTADPAKQEAYNEVLRRQWTEVLTQYGEISELWFDGSCIVDLGDIIGQYAPDAMVFQGPHATLRWPGNEAGVAPEPAWQTVACAHAQSGGASGSHSDPDGDCWLPMEMDTTLLDHKWFWAPDTEHMIKPLDKLMEIYFTSVGRGGVLLLNATPDTSGLIPESHMQRYRELGTAIRRVYENKKGETGGAGATLEIRFDSPTSITHVVLKEDIRHGHTVRAYVLEKFVDGGWQQLVTGMPVGYKRIERFERVVADALRLGVTQSVGMPNILQFAAFDAGEHASAVSAISPGEWMAVEAWDDVRLSGEWQTVELDLSPRIRKPGEYHIELRRTEGDALLETAEAMVLIANTEAPRLITPREQPNAWLIRRTDQVTEDEEGRTVLRLRVRQIGGNNWKGTMLVKTGEG